MSDKTYHQYLQRGNELVDSVSQMPELDFEDAVKRDDPIYDEAINNFSAAIELNPDAADAYIARGNAYYQKMDHAPAIADSSRAIRIDPNNPEFYLLRARIYSESAGELRIGDKSAFASLDRAIGDLKKVISLKPDYVEAYRFRGFVYEHYYMHYNKVNHIQKRDWHLTVQF